MTKTWLALAIGVALFAAAPAAADEPPKKGEVPADLIDKDFERFVDLKVLGEAVAKGKASVVADCALKLAEGERELKRKHKTINSDKLFGLAVRLATGGHDKETLARLLEGAKAAKKADLVTDVERAQKLVAVGRKVDPDAAALARATPEQAVVFRSLAEQVRAAKAVASKGQLDGLEKTINKMDPFEAGLKDSLLKQVAKARDDLPAKADPEMDVLARLAMSSR